MASVIPFLICSDKVTLAEWSIDNGRCLAML